ncbi:MAG: ABC transporter permease [Bacteroidota bacterium]
MLKNWVKIFLYHVKNNKFFTALNVLGLSLGIAGLVFAILYWNDEHAYNAWNPEKENVFQVSNDLGNNQIWPHNVYPLAAFLKTIPEVEDFVYLENGYSNGMYTYGIKKQLIKTINTQGNFFSFFPFEFVKGSAINAIPNGNSIVLREDTAQKLFGNEEALGRQVGYLGKMLTVKGVYKIPGKSSIAPEAIINNMADKLKADEQQWGNYSYGLLLKLKDPSAAEKVERAIEKIYYEYRTKLWAQGEGVTPEEYEKINGKTRAIVEQLATARLHSVVNGYPEGKGNYQFLVIMAGLSVLILVLSIVNYVNLATANAIKRAKEVGVRKILGATKANIVRQFIFETVIMTLIALLLALVIVELSLPYYNNLLNKTLVLNNSLFYLQLIAVVLIVIVLAGIFPAIYVANFNTLKVLKGNFSRSKSGVWLRNGMLILQFAIAAFFIIGSYIVNDQIKYLSNINTGFNGAQVIEVNYIGKRPQPENPREIYDHYQTFKQELKKIKGVEAVSAGSFSMGKAAGSTSGYVYNGTRIQAQNMGVDFEMLDMMGIKMLEGRNFSEQFASDTVSTILVNETALKMMREKDPIGKTIQWNDLQLKVVGVVKNFHLSGPQSEIQPMSFFHFKTVGWLPYTLDKVYIKVAPQDMEATIAAIEKFWITKVDQDYPFAYDFVDKNYARTYENFVKQRNLFSLLNGMVILIALFGLFALASYSIQRRMKEIAIRKTLGAETKMLLRELSKQYVVFCIIGFIIAFAPAWLLLNKWLENFAFRINISVIPFIVGFVVLMVLTLAVVLGRAYKATRVNVLKYLKYE